MNWKNISFVLWCFCCISTAQAEPPKTSSVTLENGLRVIVRVDKRAPIVLTQLWYKVGARQEHRGVTGISHFLEHMMFNGTLVYPEGEFVRLITEQGGQQNSFTDNDSTVYFQELKASELELSLKLEADRMMNLILSEQAFNKEKSNIIQERLFRIDDNPDVLATEKFNTIAYSGSHYQHPIIGWMQDIQSLKLTDLEQWYEQWYAPNNAVLIIVGDVEPQNAFDLAHQYFSVVPKKTIPALEPSKSLPILGKRQLDLQLPTKVPQLLMGYNVPSLNTADEPWEPYALQILVDILDAGDSARLAKNVMRGEKGAAMANAWYSPFQLHATLLTISGKLLKGEDLNVLESSLEEQIKDLQTNLISQQELERVKVNVLAHRIYEKDSLYEQAYELGSLEASGYPWMLSEQITENLQAITPQHVQAVAKKYLVPERLTIMRLVPNKEAMSIEGA